MSPLAAIVLANLFWGLASPVFKLALGNIPPFTLAFIRFFFAGLMFIPFMWRSWKPMTKQDLFDIIMAAFFGITINISFFFLGLEQTESINAPVIGAAAPVFTYFLALIFLKEKAHTQVLTGMVVSLVGVLVIILAPFLLGGKAWSMGEVQGNVFLIIATLGSVFNPIFGKQALKKMSPYQVTGIGFLFSSFTFLPFVPNELSRWSFSQLDYRGWSGIIFGVIFSSALAYYFYYYAVKKMDAQEVGIFSYLMPIIAVIAAIPLVHEYPTIYFAVGSLLVFGGIYFGERHPHYKNMHKKLHARRTLPGKPQDQAFQFAVVEEENRS